METEPEETEEELLPIDEETGEIDYEKVDDPACPVFSTTDLFGELEDLTLTETCFLSVFTGIAVLLLSAFVIGVMWLLKWLFFASPALFFGLMAGILGMFALVLIAKLRRKINERKSNGSDEDDRKS